MNLLSYSCVGQKSDKDLSRLKSRCGQPVFLLEALWEDPFPCLIFPASIGLFILAHSLLHVRTSNWMSNPSCPSLVLCSQEISPSEGPLWSHWATQIIQNALPRSRSLNLVISVKSLCHVRWHVYRFWGLGCGFLWCHYSWVSLFRFSQGVRTSTLLKRKRSLTCDSNLLTKTGDL